MTCSDRCSTLDGGRIRSHQQQGAPNKWGKLPAQTTCTVQQDRLQGGCARSTWHMLLGHMDEANMAMAALDRLTVFQQDHLMKTPQTIVCEK